MNEKFNNKDTGTLVSTGERYMPEIQGDIELEHLHRYLFACRIVADKCVLDIASGEGYGSAMLARSAYKVTGVDISLEAVLHAQAKYQADNLEYLTGSCTAIPLNDSSVDVVISFETIEHHYEHDAMMKEIKRVLRPGGVLVISSPDKLEYSDKPGYRNEFHFKELYRDEFKMLLGEYFKNNSMYGQRVVYGSAIFCEDRDTQLESYELADEALSTISGLPHSRYLIAVASDADLPLLGSGVLEQQINEAEAVRNIVAECDRLLADREQQIMETYSWRLTKPLRFLGLQVSRVRRLLRMLIGVLTYGGFISVVLNNTLQVIKEEGPVGVKHRLFNLQDTFSKYLLIPIPDGSFVRRNDYQEWILRYDTLVDEQRQNIKKRISAMPTRIKISIVMPVYDPAVHFLDEAIQSVRNQLYPYWELCIADDASKNDAVRELLEKHAKEDSRIKVVYRKENGHISAASNSALELATGEFVALMDNDDLLPEHALFWVAQRVLDHPDVGLIYSDEDKINEVGERYDPYFKCDFNYELLLAQNMVCHLAVYRRDLIESAGGFRVGFEGAQDYDLALRVLEQISVSRVAHIPRVLYHWRAIAGSTALSVDEKSYAPTAGRRAVCEHLHRTGMSAVVEPAPGIPYMNRVRFALPGLLPLVSIIIPTRDRADLLELCVNSILQRSTYAAYEIIIIDNGSVEPKTSRLFEKLPKDKVTIVRDNSPFNYSAVNNLGAKIAKGQYLCLMNNDIEILTPDWLEEMLSFAVNPDVGCVGARLWYPDGRLQHGGVILGVNGIAGHAYKKSVRGHAGLMNRARLHQSLSAVTGACLLIRRHIFDEAGGLDEAFVVALNDVDFCLRVREAGYRNIWTPYAEMIHYESASRGLDDTPEKQRRFNVELRFLQKRWGRVLVNDPAYNPNLTLEFEDCSLAWPPRISL